MKYLHYILIANALILTACANNSGGGGSSGSSAPAVQATPKTLYSDWSAQVEMPPLDLGFTAQPGNLATMYLDLSHFKLSGGSSTQPGEVDIFIGPGVDTLECVFLSWLIGDEHQGMIQSISFTMSSGINATIQQNLHDYCSSLEGIYTYSINNNELTLCPQGASDDLCTRFQ